MRSIPIQPGDVLPTFPPSTFPLYPLLKRRSINTMSYTAGLNLFMGTSKHMPALEPDVLTMDVFTPMEIPFPYNRGTAKFTGLMAVSVFMHPLIMMSSSGAEVQIWYGWRAYTTQTIEGNLMNTLNMAITTLTMNLMTNGAFFLWCNR